jgi:NAD(P)-dependent dehydrogenase (short-subunit alcohol dehydrogenase family)
VTAVTLALDVTDPAAVDTFFECVGGPAGKIGNLINNASVADTTPAIDVSSETFDRIIDINLRGAFFVAQAATRLMRGHGGGSIVNAASILAIRVADGIAPYAIAKAGLAQMTKALALEWSRFGVRVNALAPGYVETS